MQLDETAYADKEIEPELCLMVGGTFRISGYNTI